MAGEGVAVLTIKDFVVRRRRQPVVQLDSATFTTGSVVVAGGNGAGKTSLLAALAGLLPWQGKGQVRGHALRSREGQTRIGYLPADPQGLDHLTLERALAYAASLSRQSADEARQVAHELGIDNLLSVKLHRMSSGQRQLGYLAASLVRRPPVVLLDEPTTGIDAHHRMLVRKAIRQLSSKSLVISASHLNDDIDQLGDRTIVLRRGECVFDGASTDLRRKAKSSTSGLDAALAMLDQGD